MSVLMFNVFLEDLCLACKQQCYFCKLLRWIGANKTKLQKNRCTHNSMLIIFNKQNVFIYYSVCLYKSECVTCMNENSN